MEISIDSQHVIAKKSNFLSSPKLQKATRITCSIIFSPEILKKSPVSTLDIRVLLKDPSMEDAQRLRLLGFGSDLPQAPGVLVGRALASLACSWPTFCLMDLNCRSPGKMMIYLKKPMRDHEISEFLLFQYPRITKDVPNPRNYRKLLFDEHHSGTWPPQKKNPLTVISTRPLGCCRNKKNEDVRKNTVLLWWFFCRCSARKSSWTLGGILELKMTSHIVVYISSFTQKLLFNTQNVVSKSRIKKCFSICFLFRGQNSVSKCRCLLPFAQCACPSWCWVCESESTDLQTSIQPESVQTST